MSPSRPTFALQKSQKEEKGVGKKNELMAENSNLTKDRNIQVLRGSTNSKQDKLKENHFETNYGVETQRERFESSKRSNQSYTWDPEQD